MRLFRLLQSHIFYTQSCIIAQQLQKFNPTESWSVIANCSIYNRTQRCMLFPAAVKVQTRQHRATASWECGATLLRRLRAAVTGAPCQSPQSSASHFSVATSSASSSSSSSRDLSRVVQPP